MREDRALGAPAETGTSGPRRLLVAVYGTFALAAGARAAVQLATRFDEAPVAYLLSALAAVVYVVATVALARGARGRRTALIAITVELIGVLVVGTLSLVDSEAFPDETVWSAYGRGYGFVPLVLPVVGLLVLRRSAQQDRRADPQKSPPPKSPPPKSPPP